MTNELSSAEKQNANSVDGRHPEQLADFVRTHLPIPGKTVFILGSGFSRPLEIPVIRDFLPLGLQKLKSEAWFNTNGDQVRRKAYRALIADVARIADRYRRVLNPIANGMATIEQLFCLVDLIGEEAERKQLANFIRAVCEQAWEQHLSESGPKPMVGRSHFLPGRLKASGGSLEVCLYEAFLSKVLSKPHEPFAPWIDQTDVDPAYSMNAIISFNYDLVVERKLAHLEKDKKTKDKIVPYYGLDVDPSLREFPKQLVLPIVKIHGSLNWQSADDVPSTIKVCKEVDKAVDAPFVFPSWQTSKLTATVFCLLARDARAH